MFWSVKAPKCAKISIPHDWMQGNCCEKKFFFIKKVLLYWVMVGLSRSDCSDDCNQHLTHAAPEPRQSHRPMRYHVNGRRTECAKNPFFP